MCLTIGRHCSTYLAMVARAALLDPSPLAALRAATRAAHENLHVHPALSCMSEGAISPADYRRIIKSFYGFYASYEALYAAHVDARFSEFAPGVVLERLKRDLSALEVPPEDVRVIVVAPAPWTLAETVGYLYLREGSSLGGQLISRRLSSTLGLAPGIDNHFFHAYGPETGPRWKRFSAVLNELSGAFDHMTAATFASGLFYQLDHWLAASHND